MSAERTNESRLVAGPVTAAGVALAVLGLSRRSPVLVVAGGLAIGAGLKLVPPRGDS